MTKPIIETPRGKIFQTKRGKAQLAWNTGFQPTWQGRYSAAQAFVDSEVLRQSEPFTPLLTGTLIKTGILGTDVGSGTVQWIAPYARRNYYSKRKVGSATGPLRGPFWFERMKQLHGENIIRKARKIAANG